MGFSTLDAGGDVGISADGNSVESVFTAAAMGMYSLVTDPGTVNSKSVLEVNLRSYSLEGLLVAFLNELVFLLDARGFLASTVEVNPIDRESFSLVAILAGEDLDMDRHTGGLLIKAATYHDFILSSTDGKWHAEVIFDI